jgi:hypothetical protein
LSDSVVRGDRAGTEGGGIHLITDWSGGSVTLSADSSVTGNTPDDCVGTDAC